MSKQQRAEVIAQVRNELRRARSAATCKRLRAELEELLARQAAAK